MTRRKFKFRTEAPWSEVISYLRKILKFEPNQSLVRTVFLSHFWALKTII